MLFLPNCEIGIERLHAYVGQRLRIAHNHSPAFVSLNLRRDEILSFHSSHHDDLVRCAELVSDRRSAVSNLGLTLHPSFHSFLTSDNTLDHSLPHGLVNSVAGRESSMSLSLSLYVSLSVSFCLPLVFARVTSL